MGACVCSGAAAIVGSKEEMNRAEDRCIRGHFTMPWDVSQEPVSAPDKENFLIDEREPPHKNNNSKDVSNDLCKL